MNKNTLILPYFPDRDRTRDQFASVTRVIDATKSESSRKALMRWHATTKDADLVSQQARERGSEFHDSVKRYWQGDSTSIHPSVKAFLDGSGLEIQFCESWIYSNEHRYKGITDMLALHQGEYAVVEWKTSIKERKKEYMMSARVQTSAYANAIEEMYGIRVTKGFVIVAVEKQEEALSPFELPKKYFDFQVFEMGEAELRRNFNTFKKKLGQYRDPEYLEMRERQRKPIPIECPENPFALA